MVSREDARKELRRRAKIELAYRQGIKDKILDGLHDKQKAVIEAIAAGERSISLCTSRRAGKTYLLASLIILTLLDAGFGQAVFFVAQTMSTGKGFIFKDLVRLIEEYQLPWTIKEHAGVIETPAKASFRIIGMDKKTQVGKTKGFKIIGCFTDEVQEYPHLIQEFIEATGPALKDYRGLLVTSGTPGPAKQGTWYRISHALGEYQRFKCFHWSIRDNTKFPRDPEEVLREELENGGYTWDHPYFQREYLGIWAESHSLNVFEFLTNRNTFTELPTGYGLHWTHVLGLDYGYNDDTAWTVIAMCPHTTKKYVLVSEKQSGLIADQVVERTAALVQLYGLRRVVVDPSGGGKPFYEQFNRRYSKTLGCTIRPAHKAAGSVEASIHAANTELRTGRLLLHADGARPLIEELQKLRYKDETREEILSGAEYPDHCADSARYCLAELMGLRGKPRPEDMTPEQRALQEEKWLLERHQGGSGAGFGGGRF